MYNSSFYLIILCIIICSFVLYNKNEYEVSYYKKLPVTEFKIINKIYANYILQQNYNFKGKEKKFLYYCSECNFNKGDIISLKGMIIPFDKKLTPISRDYSNYIKKYSLAGKVIAKSKITIMHKHNNYLANIRTKFINLIDNNSNNPLAPALLTGNKKNIPKELYDKFKATGAAHILAISALHIGGIAFIFFYFIRIILSLSIFLSTKYNNKKIALFFSYFAALFFLFIADFPISGQRALLFLTIIYLGILYEIKISLINLILFSITFFLLLDPYLLWSAGFQMSFAAVIMICKYLNYKTFIKENNIINKIYYYEKDVFFISILISVALLPITIFHFNSSSLISPLTNLVIIPLVTLIIMPFAMLTLVGSLINLQTYFFKILDYLLNFLIDIINFFDKFTFSIPYPIKLNNYSLLLLILVLILTLISNSKKVDYVAVILYLMIFVVFYIPNQPDIVITAKNKIFIIKIHNLKAKYLLPKRRISAWDIKDLKNYYGNLDYIDTKNYQNNNLLCKDHICIYQKKEHQITIILNKMSYQDFQKLCKETNLMINLSNYNNYCYQKFNINNYNLKKYGTMNLFLGDKIKITNLN